MKRKRAQQVVDASKKLCCCSSVQTSKKGNFGSFGNFKYLCSKLFGTSQNYTISEISEISKILYKAKFPKLQKIPKFLNFQIFSKNFHLLCYVVIELMEASEISVISFFGNLNIPQHYSLDAGTRALHILTHIQIHTTYQRRRLPTQLVSKSDDN